MDSTSMVVVLFNDHLVAAKKALYDVLGLLRLVLIGRSNKISEVKMRLC